MLTHNRRTHAALLGALTLALGCGEIRGTGDGTEDAFGAASPRPQSTAPTAPALPIPTAPLGPSNPSAAGETTAPSETGDGATNAQSPAESTACEAPRPNRAPVRRLTRFEYNNSIETLLGDDSRPANTLPAELLGNGFGNDADEQPTSSLLVEQYASIAKQIAERAESSKALSRIHPCAADFSEPSAIAAPAPADASEIECARAWVERFATRAYRRPLTDEHLTELLELQRTIRDEDGFTASLTAIIEAVLQAPDFLYRVEFGDPTSASGSVLRPSGHEMASRLSYLLWGTLPDESLLQAAAQGELSTAEGVRAHAERMVEDARAWPVLRYFFEHYLPLNTLGDLARDPELFPTFSPQIGHLMRQETLGFLEYSLFEGPGDWASVLTAPYTFVNQRLAEFYGISGVQGDEFQRVPIDTSRRLGLLTQGALMAGTTISNFTNPVRRGGFVLRRVLCLEVPEPPAELAEQISPPDPYTGATGRQRYSAHSEQPSCAGCHAILDPPGFALENYDAVGLWRDEENGVRIDASGQLGALGEFAGPTELVDAIAAQPETYDCFAAHWMTFAYGRTLDAGDDCARTQLYDAFRESGYDVRQLLVALTQTDAFLYLPATSETL